MAKNDNLTDFLQDIADAIKAKRGITGPISAQNFATEIAAIEGGGASTPDMPVIGDGKTYLYIKIAAPGRMTVPLYFSQTATNGVRIDWGDGSATQTLSGTGNKNTTHTYTDIGEYTISLTPNINSGCKLGLGHNSTSYCVMGSTNRNNLVYCNMLQAVEIGRNVTSIGSYAFYSCYSLSNIVIPDSVTSIGNYAFGYCNSLSNIVIPDSVTSIGNYAFGYCYGMRFYDFSQCTSVPTLRGTSVFSSIPDDCKIVVPDNLYNEWTTATNWSTHASKIVKASEFNS